MPNENLQSVAVAEKPPVAEFTGKHLEAAFTFRANYHKQRILEKFGSETELPHLPNGDTGTVLEASEKRFQKAYDLLQRELPPEIPQFEDGLSRDHIIAIADNLAWKGIECSIVDSQLVEINKVLTQLEANGKSGHNATAELKTRTKALKDIVLEDNHFYRDFFDSETAQKLGVDSPEAMRKFFKRVSLTGTGEDSVVKRARGISLEIAAARYLSHLLENELDEVVIGYGSQQEDQEGGDIVLLQGDKVLYIDLKSMRPGNGKGFSEDEIERGYRLYVDQEKRIYKAMVWPESKEAVANESFRLTDPIIRNALQNILRETS